MLSLLIVKSLDLKYNLLSVSNLKNIILFAALYTSLIVGFIFDENLNYGSYYDWINVYVPPITDFSINFYDTLLSFEKYGQRHSPVYLIFLSFFLKIGIDLDVIRFLHLHLCLIFILLFYHCLKLRFQNIDKSILQLLSMFIFLSPTFRSLSIWPDSRLPGLIIFVLSIYFFLKFLKKDDYQKIINAWLSAFSLILSAYISPNFSLFAFFTYFFFFKHLRIGNFCSLLIFSAILSIPMFYYIFIMEVNFMTAGRTPGIDGNSIDLSLNFANKFLIISTIFLFHLLPIIYFLTDHKKFIYFMKNRFIYFLPIFIIFVYFFNYQSDFTGGGFFFQLSNLIFDNNNLFYLISFYSLFWLYYFASMSKENFLLIMIMIISNVQNTIYHKYYEPLVIILVLLLFQNLKFENFFSQKINILYIYIMSLFYILLRSAKLIYLI
tara:strand:+ start:555 stop:1862 length:1308 start_codon:yes stop_codon:yes gene_type:complete